MVDHDFDLRLVGCLLILHRPLDELPLVGHHRGIGACLALLLGDYLGNLQVSTVVVGFLVGLFGLFGGRSFLDSLLRDDDARVGVPLSC